MTFHIQGGRRRADARQRVVYRGRSRDTAWYAITDGDWPQVKQALETWLEPANFDIDGVQRRPLRVPRSRAAASAPPSFE